MALFGSTSRSTSSPTSQNAGFSEIGGNAASLNISGSGRNTVVMSDAGAIKASADISAAALALGGQSIAAGRDVSTAGLDYAQSSYESSLEFADSLVGRVLNSNRDTLSQAADSISGLAMQTAQGEGDRVQKVALYALLALGAAMVLPAVLK